MGKRNINDQSFFRDDEQATEGIPFRNEGKARCSHRPWKQTA
jgi:hypothetical protein